jgi:hypothetical protein
MHYMILDSAGNAVDTFDDLRAALDALERLVEAEPEAAEHVVLLSYDAEGNPVGEALTVEDARNGRVIFADSPWVAGAATGVVGPTTSLTYQFGAAGFQSRAAFVSSGESVPAHG